jgi:acyl carrier protein
MSEVKQAIYDEVAALVADKEMPIDDDTPLIGGGGALDSLKLVELSLRLEDIAAEMGFEFDWTSDATMSRSRSMFRTVGALAAEFMAQMEKKQ